MFAKLFALIQYPLPHHPLSRVMYWLTRRRLGAIKNIFTAWFIGHFRVNMTEALEPDYHQYPTFNSFFTRALREGARPIVSGHNEIASPVDGRVSQAGRIEAEQIFQAKGHHYSMRSLLGDSSYAKFFTGGEFATLYLSPRDYHRIHMPVSGELREVLHVPGRLFSVNPATVANVPGLFARNERVVAIFETELGPMAMVLVGAIFVASIETVWQGEVTPPSRNGVQTWHYPMPEGAPIRLEKGVEMGRFNMGSTVIVLFGPGQMRWGAEITAGNAIRMGQLLGLQTKDEGIRRGQR